MTRPIAVSPGAILEITQQTQNRELRFKPTPAVRHISMYLLVYSLRKPMHLRKRVTFPPGTFKLWRGGLVDRKATPRCGALPTYAEWLGLRPRRGDDEPPDYPTPG